MNHAAPPSPCPPPAGDDHPNSTEPGRADGRIVVRDWTDRGVWISTVHPVYGQIPRGQIRVVPGGWEWVDVLLRRAVCRGDFVEAELALLERTAKLD